MYRFSFLITFFCLSFLGCKADNGQKADSSLRAKGYVISVQDRGNATDQKWVEYFYNHLKNRTSSGRVVLKAQEGFLGFALKVNPSLGDDYCLKKEGTQWLLTAKNERTMKWLIYQCIKKISEDDSSVEGSDLLPSILRMENGCKQFSFAYRDPYFFPNMQADYDQIYNTNNVENDWGIWGHNLMKVINKTNKAVFATINGKTTPEQLDFTSEALYKETERYILDNYGAEVPMRFMIMPADNAIVSDNPKNRSLGSTDSNATPSVSYLLNRLAKHFPKHTFFTSSYLSTKTPPKERLAANTGVIISTIDIPKGIALKDNKATKAFYADIAQWKSKTGDIYLWDYASDFDDYFTPFPILKGFQKQLKSFKAAGVNGIFVNGSGYDYSSFNDLQTYVIASLLIDSELSVDDLVGRFFKQQYPTAGDLLTKYYLSLENTQQAKGHSLQLYGNLTNALRTYLDPEAFVAFYDQIGVLIPKAKGEERKALEKLYTALSYTRLQLAYEQGYGTYGFTERKGNTLQVKPYVRTVLNNLNKALSYKDMQRYKEDEEGTIKGYIAQWNALLSSTSMQSLILGEKLTAQCTLDEDYQDLSALTDGIEGFPLDYHNGWVINSADDLKVLLPASAAKAKKIAFSFLQNNKKRFYLPEKIEIYKNGTLYKTLIPQKQEGVRNVIVGSDIDLSGSKQIEVRIYRDLSSKRNLLATSEIRLIP